MQKVYFLSGLGADKRAFSFLDLSFCEPVFVDWISPLKNESLESYASRLRQQIPEEHPTIVGVSFGGMLASIMAKADDQIKAIIISSNKTASEFPGYLRAGKYMPVYKWLPAQFLKSGRMSLVFGGKGKEQKQIIRAMIKDSDVAFVKWAIGAILNWKEKEVPVNIIHIHGTTDKLLPCRFTKPDHIIKGGTHLMTLYKPNEISKLLCRCILEE